MATYIVLINFADNGIHNVKRAAEKTKAATTAADKAGIRVKEIHYTLGTYDAILVVEAPNGETIKAWSGSLGNSRTQTIPTLSVDEVNETATRARVPGVSLCEIIQWSY